MQTNLSFEKIPQKEVKQPKKANFKVKCINCGQEFLAQRRTALYCSKWCSVDFREKKLKAVKEAEAMEGDIEKVLEDAGIVSEKKRIEARQIKNFKLFGIM